MASQNEVVLIIDGGGRGSALVSKYAVNNKVKKILAIPGNDLMKQLTTKPVITYPQLTTISLQAIINVCKKEKVTLVDVAQDNAIEAGLVDALAQENIPTIGPTKAAGQIEWDKAWARNFGKKYHLPQPDFKICRSQKEGINYLRQQSDQSWFIKASGLAEGKGALPAKNNSEAIAAVKKMKKFGKSGEIYLIEKWLQSDNDAMAEEFSLFIICDGKNYQIVGAAQDHKRALNFDQGENTGGMGCITPPSIITKKLIKKIDTKIIRPTINGLRKEKRPYKGVLYLGGILIKKENTLEPYVIEFNARWGDPEAQAILPGITTDFFSIAQAVMNENINSIQINNDGKYRVVIAATSQGYPTDYSAVKGKRIYGLIQAKKFKQVKIFGAAVQLKNNQYFANGGRLFYVVGEGNDILQARNNAYAALSQIHIESNNLHYRTDIGWRDVERFYNNKK